MLVFSQHLRKHIKDIENYVKRYNILVNPLGEEVISYLESVKGTPQIPNYYLGETERWRIVIHFKPYAKIRYVIGKRMDLLVLVTAHPDPDSNDFVEFEER
jgi:hypothetical protein